MTLGFDGLGTRDESGWTEIEVNMLALLVFGGFNVRSKNELFTGNSISCGGFKFNETTFNRCKLRVHIRGCMALSIDLMKVRGRTTNDGSLWRV